MSRIDSGLFSAHEHALTDEYGRCPKCQASLELKFSKHGSFIGCSQYPDCDYSRPLTEHQNNIADQLIAGSVCPDCGAELAVKSGRYGIFIGCSQYPKCQYIEKEANHLPDVPCPNCKTGKLEKRTNRYGKSFYACSTYPKCKFLVNYPPVDEPCPECGFSILVERTQAGKHWLECPQKSCQFRRELT